MTAVRTVTPTPALCLEVCAYNDVAINRQTKPRDVASFREWMSGREWTPKFHDDDWRLLHARYVEWFDKYLHDPETLNFRDQRQRNMQRRKQ